MNMLIQQSSMYNERIVYTEGMVKSILVGLVDSDGCITWSWSKDHALIPEVGLTSKTNNIMVWLGPLVQGNSSRTGWVLKNQKRMFLHFKAWFFSGTFEDCKIRTSKRLDAL